MPSVSKGATGTNFTHDFLSVAAGDRTHILPCPTDALQSNHRNRLVLLVVVVFTK